jgi:hypothetical protein
MRGVRRRLRRAVEREARMRQRALAGNVQHWKVATSARGERIGRVRALALRSSVAVITIVLWDAFETVVLPRTVSPPLRLTRLDFRVTSLTCCRSATLFRAEVRPKRFSPSSVLRRWSDAS